MDAQQNVPAPIQSIATLSVLNPVAKTIIDDFAKRQRLRRETTLDRYERHLADTYGQIDHNQLVETFQTMENLGLGSLISGRGGKPSRFIWKYSLRDVARAAKGEIKAEEMGLTPTGKTRIVRSKVVNPKPQSVIVPEVAAPVAQSSTGELAEVMVLGKDGVLKKYEIAPDKEHAFLSVLAALAIAK